ncbi:MAG: MFS transporter [Anaerolineales bacterium]|nr:MFS transporter [Anaerolineales bacterium]
MKPIAVQQRLTWLLFWGQSASSAAYLAGSTVGAIAAVQMTGSAIYAGLPSAVYQFGSAAAAYPAARLMEREGRRLGLALGFGLGVVGAALVGAAINAGHFALFLLGYAIVGLTRGVADQARYAAAEMHPAAERARAISLVVWGGTVGAILGPALVGPMGHWALVTGQNELAGPWWATVALFGLALALTFLFLRPDPRDLARQLAAEDAPETGAVNASPARPLRAIFAQPGTRLAIAAMVVGQLVMVMIMSITSVHMTAHGHALGDVSLVITAHTLGMFGLSMISGRLADTFGRPVTIMAGVALLTAACLLAPLSLVTGVLAVALFLLGLGWNFCYVAGAALLTDTLSFSEQTRLQGGNDLVVNAISALGSLQSGVLLALIGFHNLNWLGLVIALLPLLLALRYASLRRRPAPTATTGS